MARTTRRTSATSTTPTQQPPSRGLGRGAAASSGAIAAAAANAAASAATGGVVGEILDVELNSDHAADIRDTTNHEMDDKTEKDHRRRNTEIIKWIRVNYPEQFAHCVVELTPEQKADLDRKYHTATHDFLYDKINPAIIRAFLSGEKKYKDETRTTQYSFVHIRKYHDSILHGSKKAETELPRRYHSEMKSYLKSVKKEKQKAKSKGELDEEDADPINFALYEHICRWFVEDNDVTSWAFTNGQWNCMARSVNIDPLGFHNISQSQMDCIEVAYDDTKADKTGEKLMPKNIFGNPSNYLLCFFCAMGCYLTINNSKFTENSDLFFRFGKAQKKSAAKNYCKALKKLVGVLVRGDIVVR